MGLFGSSGVRGIVTKEFISSAFSLGFAVGNSCQSLVIGSDTRTSGDVMKFAFASALLAKGCRVFDAGIAPTPTIAYAARNFHAGAIITASHNPPQYNGVKLVNPDGSAFDSLQREEIEKAIRQGGLELTSWDKMEECRVYPQAIEEHCKRILQDFPQGAKLKVVVDCGCGAASLITPILLREMGCEVIALNSYPSGFFPRGLEPDAENLHHLALAVRALGANLGIAHDGDADRLGAVDDDGCYIPGDKLLILFAREIGAKRVVTTGDASMVVEEMGFEVFRTRVGDPFVSEKLKEGGDFGGEPSGSWIFPQVSLCPDGIYAAAMLVQLASKERLSELANAIPTYPLIRGSIPGGKGKIEGLAQMLIEKTKPTSVSDADGLRLVFAEGWLLLRASGTEPKIRITAEAKSRRQAQELYNLGLKALGEG
jgi:phosphoglucosamine mutase